MSSRTGASMPSRGPSASSASCRRAQACRYSTAPISPSRRLRHWTSQIRLVIAVAFGIGHQIRERPPHQLLLGPALDRLEAGRDPGFRRKCGEQRLGEGVDGLDLEAARAIEHAGEQLPRSLAACCGSFAAPSANRSFLRSLSLSRTQVARRAPMRLAISAAAALVKVRHRIDSGPRALSSSRSTRPSGPGSCRSPPRPTVPRARPDRTRAPARLSAGSGLKPRAHATSKAAMTP